MEERIKRIIGKIIDLKEFADRQINDKYFAGQAVGLNFVLGLIYDEFPELRESEDERVRKRLIKFFQEKKNCVGDTWAGMNVDNVLAYLEKQKEQKPAEVREPSDDELERYQKELYDFKVFAAKQAREHHISFVHDFEWNNFCAELLSYFNELKPADDIAAAYQMGLAKGRKEQKPAEWSEDIIRKAVKEVGLTQHQIDWFKTNVFSPKQKWSEDDNEILGKFQRLIILCRSDLKYIQPSEFDTLGTWLKDLPSRVALQSKQEWSKEDEKLLDFWLDVIDRNDWRMDGKEPAQVTSLTCDGIIETTRRIEEAARRIHDRAHLEAKKYSNSHGGSITEEVAYGRGFKAGFIEGYEQAEKDLAPAFEFPFDVPDNDGYLVFTAMDNQTIRKALKLKKGEGIIVSIRKDK